MPVPTITLPNGDTALIITSSLVKSFSTWAPPIQRKTIRILEEFMQEIHANGSLAYLLELKVTTEAVLAANPKLRANGGRLVRLDLLDRCNWQLAQFLRYSTPTRITEALAPLTVVISTYRTIYGDKKVDVVPNLYLAVALSKIEGEEARALEAYKLATENINPLNTPKKNMIWAMANIAHLFRRLNQIPEAEEQESLVREWILGHPYAYPPSEIRSAIHDDDGTGTHILDHPSVLQLFNSIVETGPKTATVPSLGVDLIYGLKPPVTGTH